MASLTFASQSAFAGRTVSARPQVGARRQARAVVRMAAAGRTTWLPSAPVPAHLDGSMPGDFGFDPLGLGSEPDRLKWYAEAEKTNGRWAMMAVAGILFTEALGFSDKWFNTGYEARDQAPLPALIAMEALVMGFIETKRLQGFKETGKSGFLNAYPFDPAGMASPEMAVKEVKNGRLAMVAFAGFAVQALVTRQGPIANLTSHVSDPFGSNIGANIMKLPETLAQ
mmetsp:Transcript_11685/g.29908  ORF Transcript_11685/g.29908 Transcript_11685/m.29908 type:complete len:226 (+) Transcript_11685:86-763(+)|eukprot:jgi/Tetstr1/434757/TSEL_023808.t1